MPGSQCPHPNSCTHIHSPCHLAFGLNQSNGIRTQVQGWGDVVTSLRSSERAQDRATSQGSRKGADILNLGQKKDLASMGTSRTATQGL